MNKKSFKKVLTVGDSRDIMYLVATETLQIIKKLGGNKMKKELVLEINEDYGRTTAACVLEHLGYSCTPEYDEVEDRTRWKVYLGDKKYWFKE